MRHAVGAVAVEEQGRRAVELGRLAIEQRHRHRLAVLRRRHDAARDVERRVVAARNFLSLAKLSRPRVHVVVEHLRRRRHRRIGEAQGRRVVFVAVRDAERIGLLGEGDGVLLAVGEAAHDDARQAVLALEPNEKVLVGDDVEDQPPGLVRLDLPPMLAARRIDRRLDDSIILGAAGIGQDDQPSLVMIDRVIVLGLARRDEARRRAADRRHRSG